MEDNYKASSMLKIVSSQFMEHKFAVVSLIVIFLFVIIAFLAPFIGKILRVDPYHQNIFSRYKPIMTKIEKKASGREEAVEIFIDINNGSSDTVIKEARKLSLIDPAIDNEDYLFDLMEAMVADEEILSKLKNHENPAVVSFANLTKDFSKVHYLGTDELGRDVLMRLIYGSRVSIAIGILVALISAVIGLVFGSIAGYYGGVPDAILMRITDSLLALPLIPVLILFAAADIKQIPGVGLFIHGENESIAKMIVVLCLFSWMTVARLVRASILSYKEKEFIYAARALGTSDIRIMLLQLTPNIMAPLLVAVTLNVGNSILFESALSFLGLGVQPPTATWGNMLNNAQELIHYSPMLAILPGTLIFITVICFNFVGDGLQDAIDPKSIKR